MPDEFQRLYGSVYYDAVDGGFVRVVNVDEDTIGLQVPWENADESKVFHEWDKSEISVEDLEQDLYPVPYEATEEPMAFLSEILDLAQSGEALSVRAQRGLNYVRMDPTNDVP